jgi:hypothetical protein
MAESNQLYTRSLECLRFQADCHELAKRARSPDLQSHYLRMADVWLALAASGTSNHPEEDIWEAETQTT